MHLFCAAVRIADDQKIKNKNIYSIRVLFSNVLWNQHRKHHNVQSETRKLSQGANENSDRKTRKLPEARKNVNGLSAKKTEKKNQFLAPQQTIFNRPLLHQTHSLVPKYCERRIPKEKCYLSKHLTCEEKGRVFFEHVMSIMHGAMCGKSDVPCTRIMLPWERQQCARSLRISVPGSLMMVITGAAFRLSREQKKVFWRYSVCWLCKSSRLFPWIKTIKNCFEQLWTF